MNPLHIFAKDPGSTKNGWARITLHREHGGGYFTFDRGGHCELDRGWLTAELQQLRDERGVFAMEVLIGGRFKGRMTRSLNETAEMQGRLLDIAGACGFEPPRREPLLMAEQTGVSTLLIPAGDGAIDRGLGIERVRSPTTGKLYSREKREHVKVHGWRGELCHDSRASDAQIALVAAALVEGASDAIALLPYRQREHVWDALGLAVVAAHRHIGLRVRLPQVTEQALAMQKLRDKAKPAEKKARLYSRATRAEIGARSKAAHARRATR